MATPYEIRLRACEGFILFHIATLKECFETEYWLELFVKSDILNRETAIDLYNQCGTIRRILIASISTAKESGDGKK